MKTGAGAPPVVAPGIIGQVASRRQINKGKKSRSPERRRDVIKNESAQWAKGTNYVRNDVKIRGKREKGKCQIDSKQLKRRKLRSLER